MVCTHLKVGIFLGGRGGKQVRPDANRWDCFEEEKNILDWISIVQIDYDDDDLIIIIIIILRIIIQIIIRIQGNLVIMRVHWCNNNNYIDL